MKILLTVLAFSLITACVLPIMPELIDGVWSGWEIVADGMIFSTPIGLKTINYHVQITQHNDRWYIWDNGFGLEIIYKGEL